jgi:hypothetical protein
MDQVTKPLSAVARGLAARSSALSLLLALLLCAVPLGRAQLYSGSVTGLVTDAQGALIPSASVILVNQENGFSFDTKTNGEGRYLIRAVPPGKYKISASAAQFSTELKQGLAVDVNQNLTVNFFLKTGNVNQVVNVTARGGQLQSQDAVTGQVVDRKLINDLPLISRSVTDLAYLAPGITDVDTTCVGCYANNFVSNGSRNMTADVLMDGVSTTNFDQNSGIQEPLYLPSVDAVEEFKVQQSNFSAEFGFSGSTVLNLVTRSGTNAFHGTLYEFLRNSALDANNWFNDQAGLPIPPLKHNDFGGTIGGPIRKNKAFFFFDYEGVRDIQEANEQAGVPSAAEKAGDFGELCTLGAVGGGTFDSNGLCTNPAGQLWDPYSGVYSSDLGGAVRSAYIPFNNLARYQSSGSPALAGTPYQLQPAPGNLIDPVAAKMMQYFPAPNLNVGSSGYNPYNNWIGSGPNPSTNNQWDIKIDYQFQDKGILTGKYSQQSSTGHVWNCFGNVADPCTGGPYDLTAHLLALNYTYTFNAASQINVSFGGNRQMQFQHSVLGDYPNLNPVTLLGEPSYMLRSGIPQIPAITLNSNYSQAGSASGIALGSAPYSYFHEGSESYPLLGSLSWIYKSHEFKFGAEGRLHRINFIQPGNPGGQFTFDYTGTSEFPSASNGSPGGDALASFLTGVNTGGLYEVPIGTSTQSYQASGFFQDNWKVLPTVTLNLGIRYDLSMPRTERHNKMNWLDPNVISPLQVAGLGVLHGGEVFANSNERTNSNPDFRNIQPRFGFAWQVIPNTVLRGGFGMYYSTSQNGAAGNGAVGFQGYDEFTASITTYQNDGATPYGRLSDPYPGVGPKFPPGSSLGLLNDLGNGAAGPIRSQNSTPYEETWSFGLQRQFPWKFLMQADYVGKRGIHLYYGGAENLDHLGRQIESYTPDQIANLNSYVPNPFYGYITDPNSALSSPTVPAFQLQLPFPQFGSFSTSPPPIANSIYHALQFKAEKQFSSGLQFLFTYVRSKSIDNASTTSGAITFLGGQTSLQDPNNLDGERSVSTFDIPNVYQFTAIYELPFGRGRAFAGNMNRTLNAFVGDWQVNTIYRYSNGRPVLITLQGGQSLPTYGAQRPNISGILKRRHGSETDRLNNYFANPEVISIPAAFTLGNVPRATSSVRQPGQNTASLSVFKEFPLGNLREGARLEFRFEAFNALNHPQFGGPNATFNSGQFGLITSSGNERQVQAALKLYY